MISGLGNFFVNYLLLPIVFLILGVISVVIAKKNELLSDKKAVFYVLLSSLLFSLFGLCGFFGINFMPYVFVFLQFLFLLLGWLDYKLLHYFIKTLKTKSPFFTLLIMFLQLVLAWALFSILFNVTNELQYGFWAATSLFPLLFIPLFIIMYQSYLQIPAEIFKMKVYKTAETFELPHTEIDVESLSVYEIEIPKKVDDEEPIRIKAKAVNSFVFGTWFGMIVTDYNNKKVDNQIEINDKEESYGWIFYTEKTLMKSRRYLDPDISFEENKLKGDELIIAKRVKKVE